jgi:hypothetical protein
MSETSQVALDEWGEACLGFAVWMKRYGERFIRVERNSHPPVAFVECSECHAVVFEESVDDHRVWHKLDGIEAL